MTTLWCLYVIVGGLPLIIVMTFWCLYVIVGGVPINNRDDTLVFICYRGQCFP